MNTSSFLYLAPALFIFPGMLLTMLIHRKPLRISIFIPIVITSSIAIVVITEYLLLYGIGLSIKVVAMFVTTGVVLCGLAVWRFRKRCRVTYSWQEIRHLLFFLTVTIAILLPLKNVRVQIAHEGTIHIPLVYQVLNNIVPPSHHALAGEPANTYWFYAAFVALLTQIFNLSPLVVSVVIAFLVVFCVMVFGYVLARDYTKHSLLRILAGVLMVTSVGMTSAPVIAVKYLLGSTAYGLHRAPEDFLMTGLPMYSDTRLFNILHKLINIDGFRLGTLFFTFTLYLLNEIMRRSRPTRISMVLVITAISIFILHPVSGLVAGSCGLILFLFSAWRGVMKPSVVVAFIIAGVLSFPYLNEARYGISGDAIRITLSGLSGMYLWNSVVTYLPLLPFVIVGLRTKVLTIVEKQAVRFLLSCFAAFYILILFIALPDRNQYKFVMLFSVPLALASVHGLSGMAIRYRNAGVTFLFTLCGTVFAMQVVAYTHSSWAEPYSIASRGKDLVVVNDPPAEDVYRWIQIMTPEYSVIAGIPTLPVDAILLMQRRPFVVHTGTLYTERFSSYDYRLLLQNRLIESNIDDFEVILQAMRTEVVAVPLYILVDRQHPDINASSIVSMFDSCGSAEMVFTNERYVIFKVV